MTKLQYFQKNELSAYKIAAASYIELSMTKALLDQLPVSYTHLTLPTIYSV